MNKEITLQIVQVLTEIAELLHTDLEDERQLEIINNELEVLYEMTDKL